MPHFLNKPYSDTIHLDQFDENETCPSETCSTTTLVARQSSFYGFFIAGAVLIGIGSASLRTLGVVFIDENFSETKAPAALGFYMVAGQAIGPAVGFIGGGLFLKLWVDGLEESADTDARILYLPTDISPELWVGNWWIVFLITGGAAIVIGIMITGLPHQLKGANENQAQRTNTQQKGIKSTSGELKDSHKTTLSLLMNLPFVLMVMAQAFEEGFRTFSVAFALIYFQEMYGILWVQISQEYFQMQFSINYLYLVPVK